MDANGSEFDSQERAESGGRRLDEMRAMAAGVDTMARDADVRLRGPKRRRYGLDPPSPDGSQPGSD